MTKQELYDVVDRDDKDLEYLDGRHDGHGATTWECEYKGIKFSVICLGVDGERPLRDPERAINIHPPEVDELEEFKKEIKKYRTALRKIESGYFVGNQAIGRDAFEIAKEVLEET